MLGEVENFPMTVTENVMGGVIVMFIFLIAGAIVVHSLTEHTVDRIDLTKNKYLEEAYSSDFNAVLQATEPMTMRSFSDLLTDALYYRQDNLTFGNRTINTKEFFKSTLDAAIGEDRYYLEIKPKIIEVSLNFVIDGSDSLQDERDKLAEELPGIIEGVKKKIMETGEEVVVANVYILGNKYDLKDRQKCDLFNTDRADITCYVIGAEEMYAATEDSADETYDVNNQEQYKIDFKRLNWEVPFGGIRHKFLDQDGIRLRLVEYDRSMPLHWCEKPHYGIVLEGIFEIEFDHETIRYVEGEGLFLPAGREYRHKARVISDKVVVFFVETLSK